MNFLVLISAISSLLSTTIIPVGTKSINNNTSSRCYYYRSGWTSLNNIKQITADLTNNNQTEECDALSPCRLSIFSKPIKKKDKFSRKHRIPKHFLLNSGCLRYIKCSLSIETSLYQDHADYDVPHRTQTTECCQGNLCNTLDNLPNTNKFLNSPARNMEAHNKKCPNYSNNYQVIWLDYWKRYHQDFIIESGSNLLLTSHSYVEKSSLRSEQKYNSALWLVSRISVPKRIYRPIIYFKKNGNMHYYEQSQDYIAKNKIFFVTADTMHICNFTEAEGSLTIKHVDISDKIDRFKIVNIIVKSSATSPTKASMASTTEHIIPTTTLTTTSEVPNYSSKTNNNLFKASESTDNSWKLPVIIIVPTLTAVIIIAIASYKKYGTYFHNNKTNNLLENQYGNENL